MHIIVNTAVNSMSICFPSVKTAFPANCTGKAVNFYNKNISGLFYKGVINCLKCCLKFFLKHTNDDIKLA